MRFDMALRDWILPPRHMLALFAATILVPACAMAWLAWQTLREDRTRAEQARRERLDIAAGLIGGRMLARLSEIEDRWPALRSGDGAVVVRLHPRQVEVLSGGPLLYRQVAGAAGEAPYERFRSRGNRRVSVAKDYAKGIRLARELRGSADPAVRAGALLRLARNYRHNDQPVEAIAAYEDLARLGPATLDGLPVDLVARHGVCTVLEQQKSKKLADCAKAFQEALASGRWPLDESSYEFHSTAARRWLGLPAAGADADALALAAAVDQFWVEWQQAAQGGAANARTPDRSARDREVLVAWRGSASSAEALIAGPRWLRSYFASAWDLPGIRMALTDAEGQYMAGDQIATTAGAILRSPIETRLPWTVRLAYAPEGNPDADGFAMRRRLLLAGLAVVALVVLAGSYFIARAASRELAIGRLQSDFVSAVSHEFRTHSRQCATSRNCWSVVR